MKRIKLTSKLSINREVLRTLTDDEMGNAVGGLAYATRTCSGTDECSTDSGGKCNNTQGSTFNGCCIMRQ